MARLVVQDRTGDRTVELDKDTVVLGRASENQIQIRDQMASRRHCQVERDGNGWKVVDLESSNGTNVNGKTINSHPLVPGDEIQIGDAKIRFEDDSAPKGAPKSHRTATAKKKKPASTKKAKSESGEGDSEDRRKTTRRRRGIKGRSGGIPAPVVGGGIVVVLVILIAVVASTVGGDDPDAMNAVLVSEAKSLLDKGDRTGAQKKLDQLRNPGARIKEEHEALKVRMKSLKLEDEARERWTPIDRMPEGTPEQVAAKRQAIDGFLVGYPDSSFAGQASSEKTRLASLETESTPRGDPLATDLARARSEAGALMERLRFGEAEQVWVEFRKSHLLKGGDVADKERQAVLEKAKSEFDRIVSEARAQKESDPEEARRTIERIVDNFGIQSHVDGARRLLVEEFE